MLEKLWKVVTQRSLSQSDPNNVIATADKNTSSDTVTRKNSALAENTKPQIKPSTTSERKFHESLNFSRMKFGNRVEGEVIAGFGGKENSAVESEITKSGVGCPRDKIAVVKDKDHVMKIQENEVKTAENRRTLAAVPGLKRRAPHGMGSLTSIDVCSEFRTGCESTPKSLITPSTSLSGLSKRARECYGEIKSETPKSSTMGLLLKRGLAKQTLSNDYKPRGCSNPRMSLAAGESKSVTANLPCKPSNIEPRAVTTPSLSARVNQTSVQDGQQQKQSVNKDINLITHAFASHTSTVTKAKNYPMHFNKALITPKGKPSPFTPSSVIKTKLNSPATPPIVSFNGGGVTPPLCQCGRRTRRRSVVNPGPNQGRAFFTCSLNHGRSGRWSSVSNKKARGGCNFFRWEVHL